MYPNIPYEGLSWPITQHAGVLKVEVFDGLLNACLLCKGDTVDAEKINGYLVNNGILTANVRADSNQVDAWRDYQQILSEFGLIYSTRLSKVLTLTPIAMAYLNHSLSYSELITLQLLRYQYPNGHKSQLSPSLMQSYGKNFNYESFTELQAHYNIQVRPAVLIWKILYKLWESGEQPILSLNEMQGYAVRCTAMSDYFSCAESIIESRHDGQQLQPLTRARRNMADWMKLLSQTLLFNVSGDGNTIALSPYSIKERKAVDYVCSRLSDPFSFWEYKEDNYKQDWFDFYGDYDNSIEYILKESQ
ncbi:hypothetical protein D1841_03695 [Neglecta sp. X4]|uniref:hypothetical protein n=1 Tax=unclassified Neglectibacter TaxID=2632164 RepID=UPI00136A5D53|nr:MULTISPECIES: hypothetical protein [unclassified Neglectibacter]NBI17028.1 hypothetical protein [Neglectibacter sp. 59]NBJ72440.1 hypothetical protein [Neglectibacter sp. X4]NCE80215.1 hypothetical protein [Neglectibacter sp. X58]